MYPFAFSIVNSLSPPYCKRGSCLLAQFLRVSTLYTILSTPVNEFDEAESQRRAAGAVSAAATPSSGTFNRERVEKK